MRTLVDIPEAQLRRLDSRARRDGRSRAALIREAVDKMLGPEETLSIDDVYGLWGDHAVDGLQYQQAIRSEWDRPWRGCHVIELDERIAVRAAEVRRETRLELPDAIVWATAIATDRILVTRDQRDFPDQWAKVERPYSYP